jgi:hypothetical protein
MEEYFFNFKKETRKHLAENVIRWLFDMESPKLYQKHLKDSIEKLESFLDKDEFSYNSYRQLMEWILVPFSPEKKFLGDFENYFENLQNSNLQRMSIHIRMVRILGNFGSHKDILDKSVTLHEKISVITSTVACIELLAKFFVVPIIEDKKMSILEKTISKPTIEPELKTKTIVWPSISPSADLLSENIEKLLISVPPPPVVDGKIKNEKLEKNLIVAIKKNFRNGQRENRGYVFENLDKKNQEYLISEYGTLKEFFLKNADVFWCDFDYVELVDPVKCKFKVFVTGLNHDVDIKALTKFFASNCGNISRIVRPKDSFAFITFNKEDSF